MIADETVTYVLPAHVYLLFISPRLPLTLPAALPVLIFPHLDLVAQGVIAAPFLRSCDSFSDLALTIMVNSPVTIDKGTIVATMILLETASDALALEHTVQGPRPTAEFKLNGRVFSGLLDTGADVSVIRSTEWPAHWPTDDAPSVRGVGGVQPAKISTNWLPVTSASSTLTAFIKPVILPLHTNLWGRDLMSQFQAKLSLQ